MMIKSTQIIMLPQREEIKGETLEEKLRSLLCEFLYNREGHRQALKLPLGETIKASIKELFMNNIDRFENRSLPHVAIYRTKTDACELQIDISRFEHDCNTCEFLGWHEEFDLYYCKDAGSIILRHGSLGEEYTSLPLSVLSEQPEIYTMHSEKLARGFSKALWLHKNHQPI